MNRIDIQWSLLRGALSTLTGATVVSAVLVSVSAMHAGKKEVNYLQQRARLDQVADFYRSARNDRALYSRYLAVFENLQRRGVIGDEPRLHWIEALERINQTLELPVLHYEIQPQRPLALRDSRYDTADIRLYRSPMSLDMRLFHEGDLVKLLRELRRDTSGRFALQDCKVEFLTARRARVLDTRQPNLAARCNLEWYTLQVGASTARRERGL